jgi:hypothetical protein
LRKQHAVECSYPYSGNTPINTSHRAAGILILFFGIVAVLYFTGYLSFPKPRHPAPESIAGISERGILKARVYLEMADTPQAREQDLMNRTSLAPDHGMLFVFEKPPGIPSG